VAEKVSMIQVHGTCVELEGVACLLRGPPGSGKSDLALRLFDHGARLVADDQVALRRDGDRVIASAPADFAGAIEVRGIGVVRLEGTAEAPLGLVVDLVSAAEVERMPETGSCEYLGVTLVLMALAPFEASAAAKVRLAVGIITGSIMPVL
jgi:serine kinase of HPr protein (carbohydrate metabolism regulator)